MSDSFPTFVRFARFISRTAHLWLLLLLSVASGVALWATAWFLTSYGGYTAAVVVVVSSAIIAGRAIRLRGNSTSGG